jgi:hypothetical protein
MVLRASELIKILTLPRRRKAMPKDQVQHSSVAFSRVTKCRWKDPFGFRNTRRRLLHRLPYGQPRILPPEIVSNQRRDSYPSCWFPFGDRVRLWTWIRLSYSRKRSASKSLRRRARQGSRGSACERQRAWRRCETGQGIHDGER